MGFYARRTTNMNGNGGFEVNVTDWTAANSASFTRSTAEAAFGAASGLVECGGVQFGLIQRSSGALTSGVPYTFSMWVNRTETADDWRIDFSSGGLTGSTVVPLTLGWQRVTLTATSSSASATNTRLVNHTAAAASDIYVDGVQLEQQASATPYVDTNGGNARTRQVRTGAGHFYAPSIGREL